MDLKYIIHPQTNKKIDLFSNDGLTILNQYITIFKFGGDGNFKLGYRTSRRHDKLYKIDKTLGRFHNITEKKKGKKGKGKVYRNCKYLNKGGAGEIYLYTYRGKKYIIKRLFKAGKRYSDNVTNINKYILSHYH